MHRPRLHVRFLQSIVFSIVGRDGFAQQQIQDLYILSESSYAFAWFPVFDAGHGVAYVAVTACSNSEFQASIRDVIYG